MSRDIVSKPHTYNSILKLLGEMGLIKNNKLHNKISDYLIMYPQLVQQIIILTSFLVVNTSIQQRIYCIINNIVEQPTCYCGVLLKMRVSGKYRNTFADFCSSKCAAKHANTKNKRYKTNIERYGVDNLLKIPTIRYNGV